MSKKACIGTIYTAMVEFRGETYTHDKVDSAKAGGIDYKYVYMTQGEDGLYHGSLTTDETYAYGRYNSVYVVEVDEHENGKHNTV